MNQQEASRVVAFLAQAKPTTDTMKGHIVNSINALLMSPDPMSVRFCQVLAESMNRAAGSVLNESASPVPPQAMQQFGQQPVQQQSAQQQQQQLLSESPEKVLEAISNRAAMLLG